MGNRKYHKNTADAGTTKYFDYSLLFIIIFLVLFGLVMLYSVSAYEGQDVFNDPFHYLKRQAGCAFLGFIGMFIVSVIPCEWWKKLSFPIYVLSFLMCAAVIVVGKGSNGSTRWLKIGPIQLQPSEIAKIAVIIFMAALLSRIPKQVKDLKSIIKILLFALPMVGVIAVSNLSTAIIVGGIAVLMIFVVSPKVKEFFILGAGLVALGAIGVKMGGYRVTRIAAWLHPEDYPDDVYQTLQGMYAIGSGGLFGVGFGRSVQKMGFIPESHNDMIFSVVCEELGIVGAAFILIIFLILLRRMAVTAMNARDRFGSMLTAGVMAHVAVQLLINVSVVTNTIPPTGVPMPFVSYGGSSIIFILMEMGIVMSVSRGISYDETDI